MINPILSTVRLFVLTLILATAASAAFAQAPAQGNSKISGIVLDSSAAKSVEFASVALFNAAENKPLDGTTADENGRFTISKVAPGTYRLLISFIGYKDKSLDVKVEKGKDVELGNVQLASSVQNLQEVTITGEKALVEEKVDRLVFNAEKDITSKGGDASDLLRKYYYQKEQPARVDAEHRLRRG